MKKKPSGDHLARLDEHFHKLLELDASAREAYLTTHCPDNALQDELRGLLAADAGTGTIAGPIVAREASATVSGTAATGQRFGAYRTLEKIGEGGMGSVFRGVRVDGEFEQQVAVKLLRLALPTTDAVERFRRERQLLAGLEHPGIARMFDGGTTDDGLPYLIMEMVDGQAIDKYCQEQHLSVRRRLVLFQKVCAAVQSAHQRLIVHRDIKPANILVDSDGQPKLLDFGIAKALEDEGRTADTLTGQHMMTPEYASPEQIQGRQVTTATDVYSLGVLLYTLLSGVSPFARWREKPLELQQAVCTTDPMRPSVAARTYTKPDDGPLGKIHSDMDHIVLKAMRKEPEQRYPSAAALAEDIQRHLDRLPVQARRGTLRYRSVKFLQRNAVPVAASVLLASLVGFYTWQLGQQRDLAERERASAERVAEFMVGLFENADPELSESELSARDLLRAGVDQIDNELKDEPLLAARLLLPMGDAFVALNDFESGVPLLRRALALVQNASVRDEALLLDAMDTTGYALYRMENWAEAEPLLREAVDLSARQFGEGSIPHITAINTLAHMLLRNHRRDAEIGQQLQWAIDVQLGQESADPWELASSAHFLGSWLKLNYRYREALEAELRSHELAEIALGPDNPRLLWIHENTGRILWRLGDCQAAIEQYKVSLNRQDEVFGPLSQRSVWTRYFLSICQHNTGDYAGAIQTHSELIPLEESGTDFGNGRYLSRALARYGSLLADMGAFETAAENLARAEEVLTAGVGADSVEMFHVAYGMARLYQLQDDWPRAIAQWRRYVELRRRELAPEAPQLALGELRLADALRASGDMAAAEPLIGAALPRLFAIHGAEHPEYGLGLAIRGRLRMAQGQTDAAKADFSAALSALPAHQRNDEQVARLLDDYATLLASNGNQAEADALLVRSRAIKQARIQAKAL